MSCLAVSRCALLATILTSALTAADEMIHNGDMTTGADQVTHWTDLFRDNTSAGPLVSKRDTTTFVSAPSALCLAATDGAANGNVSQLLEGVAGKTVKISGSFRAKAEGTVGVSLWAQDGSYKQLMWQNLTTPDMAKADGWSAFSSTVTIPKDAARVRLMLFLNGTGTIWLDDVVVASAP